MASPISMMVIIPILFLGCMKYYLDLGKSIKFANKR